MESDTDLRARTQLAPQSLSVAGPEGAHCSHARNADGRCARRVGGQPGAAKSSSRCWRARWRRHGGPGADRRGGRAAGRDDAAPTDKVTVRGAEILRYQARGSCSSRPDRAVALAEANRAMKKYTESMHRLGMEVTLDGIYARAAGVQR